MQLFILLQLAYLVFLFGKLLEDFYSNPTYALESAIKNIFYMMTLILFMTVLWRHYQKDQRRFRVMQLWLMSMSERKRRKKWSTVCDNNIST
jgi:ABC-type uncharacterized transport system permease subunit